MFTKKKTIIEELLDLIDIQNEMLKIRNVSNEIIKI